MENCQLNGQLDGDYDDEVNVEVELTPWDIENLISGKGVICPLEGGIFEELPIVVTLRFVNEE